MELELGFVGFRARRIRVLGLELGLWGYDYGFGTVNNIYFQYTKLLNVLCPNILLTTAGGERSGAPQFNQSRSWEKNRRPNSNSGDSWDKDRDKGMNRCVCIFDALLCPFFQVFPRCLQIALSEALPPPLRWANVRRHNMVEPGGSGTSGGGPNSVPGSSTRSGHYRNSYDHRDDHVNSQIGGGEGGGASKSSYNPGQCTGYAVNTL